MKQMRTRYMQLGRTEIRAPLWPLKTATKTNSRVKREPVPSSRRHSVSQTFVYRYGKLENNNILRKAPAEASLRNVYTDVTVVDFNKYRVSEP